MLIRDRIQVLVQGRVCTPEIQTFLRKRQPSVKVPSSEWHKVPKSIAFDKTLTVFPGPDHISDAAVSQLVIVPTYHWNLITFCHTFRVVQKWSRNQDIFAKLYKLVHKVSRFWNHSFGIIHSDEESPLIPGILVSLRRSELKLHFWGLGGTSVAQFPNKIE